MDDENLGEIVKRLDVIISLLVGSIELDGRKLSTRDQIFRLHGLGLRPIEISVILGKKPTFISKELSIKRKS